MIIYKDRISGDEMLTDIYKLTLKDDLYYVVDGKTVSESTVVSDDMIGGNASAEGGGDEGGEDVSTSGVNIILANRLQQMPPYTKKEYQTYIKGYCKRILDQLKEDAPERAEVFAKGMPNVLKTVIFPNIKNWEFYVGESQDSDGMVALLDYREDEAGEIPYMIFFKDGLIEEKV